MPKARKVPPPRDVPDELSYIAEPLRSLAIPVDDLALDPTNSRSHDRRNIDAIKASLERFGQRAPIVVQQDGMIVRSGNGRLIAARELGWTHVAALVRDETDAEAVAWSVVDNRTAELAEWDEKALLDALAAISDGGDPLDPIMFSGDEIEALRKLVDGTGDPDNRPVEYRDDMGDQAPPTGPVVIDHTCPRCGFGWSGT